MIVFLFLIVSSFILQFQQNVDSERSLIEEEIHQMKKKLKVFLYIGHIGSGKS